MFFSKSFIAILEELSSKVFEDYSSKDNFELAIQAWCDRLNFSEEIASYIKEGFRKQGINLKFNSGFFKDTSVSYDYGYGYSVNLADFVDFIKRLDSRFFSKNLKVKFYLLYAFVVISVGYMMFKVTENNKHQESQVSEQKYELPKASQLKHSLDSGKKFILILIVNSRYETLIRRLKDNEAITPDLADQLYHATQELWFGPERNFFVSPLKGVFDDQQNKINPLQSEYDVYFVKIDLNQKESGFEEKVSQLSRADGFTQLPNIVQKVEVSERLPSKAYENIGVYSR